MRRRRTLSLMLNSSWMWRRCRRVFGGLPSSTPIAMVTAGACLLLIALLTAFVSWMYAAQSLDSDPFEGGFDNVSGSSEQIVPDVVHYIKFRSVELDFIEMLSIRSVQVNHRPERIIIHCSMCLEADEEHRSGSVEGSGGTGGLRGKYWDYVAGFVPPIEVRHLSEPTHVFGKRLSSVYHSSDVARLVVLMERGGGIYLDSDVFVVRSLRPFLHYEFAVGWPLGESIGTQVLVAHERSRFLRLWLDSYRWYRPFMWYYNAGQLPTESILADRPELVHRVPWKFGVHYLIDELYKRDDWPDWREYYAVHLLSRHRSYLDGESTVPHFDEENVKRYNFTFGQMARSVLYGTTDLLTTHGSHP